ncbi:MAG: ABC transporter permease [Thermoleophilia bacterium]|nr:ABC transporter permease [Thermoleophilia bacterium]
MSPHDVWEAFNDPNLDGPGQLATHVRLSLIALAAATAAGVALGVAAAKLGGRWTAFMVVSVSNLGRTVPTFALMALVVALTSIGERPALAGLVLLGIPPVLLNAYTAVRGVDPAVTDAARGMGFTRLGVLTRVEIPLSLPLVFAGIRISAIQIVATAVLAAAVGAGGLGVLILAGLANSDDAVLLAGAVPTALLAVGTGLVLGLAQWLLTPRGLRPRTTSHTLAPHRTAPRPPEKDTP